MGKESEKSKHHLTVEEEKKLCERMRAGDKEARDEIITSNMNFARSIAHKKYMSIKNNALQIQQDTAYDTRYRQQYLSGIEYSDIEAAAYEGLIKASSRFDAEKGRFTTYAKKYIENEIYKELIKNFSGGLGIKFQREKDKNRIRKLIDKTGNIDIHYIARYLKMKESYAEELLKEIEEDIRIIRINDMTTEIPDNSNKEDENELLYKSLMENLNELDIKEQYVIKSKFGLDGHKKKTLKDIQNEEEFKDIKIYNYYKQAINKLKQKLKIKED